ncbi:MAG: VOC family protein [Acidimicrobiia bacterium]|jgi:lactoylglutathione lyase|nr:VOC family protein [Acidimicrobiia bacterium]
MATKVGQYCINVTDLERSERFYEDIVGLKVQTRTQIENVNEVVLAADKGGGRLQLAQHLDRTGPIDHGDALWKVYMIVDDCIGVHQRAVDAGFESTMEPERLDRWPVTVAFILDPDGYSIELVQRDGEDPPGAN